jgi:large subunit ribosomal protein L24
MEVTQFKQLHIKKGDTVYVVSGKEKGKTGKVLKLLKDNKKAVVEKLNIVKRHARPSQKNPGGGIFEKEAGIHVSKLMVYCTKCSRGVRIGRKKLANGEKVRCCRRCGKEIRS